MSIATDYPNPVWVNGYQCRNCTDVDYAKKHIDPDHPKSGPFGIDAESDPSRAFEPAVKLGGVLAQGAAGSASQSACAPCGSHPGARLDLSV